MRQTPGMSRVAIAVKWTVLIGVTAGTVCRLLMRAIAGFSKATPAFSWSGTLSIVLFFVLAMLPGALTAAFTRSRWRWLVLAVPTGLLALGGVGIASTVVDDAPASLPMVNWIGVWTATALIMLIVGAQGVLVLRRIDRDLDRKPSSSGTFAAVGDNRVA